MPPDVDWLDEEEAAAWRSYLTMTQLLMRELDRQLMTDAGMPHTYYAILVTLSQQPEQFARVSDLAAALDHSMSRISHALSRLQEAGWVCREECPTDRRTSYAVLTDEGRAALESAAPGHVATVRANLFDHLSRAQVRQLAQICDAALDHLAQNCATGQKDGGQAARLVLRPPALER